MTQILAYLSLMLVRYRASLIADEIEKLERRLATCREAHVDATLLCSSLERELDSANADQLE